MAKHKEHEAGPLQQAEEFYQKHNKVIIAVGSIVLLLIIFFVYKNYRAGQQEKQAAPLMSAPQNYFAADSFRLALYGDGINDGFLAIADDYGKSKSGNLAKYYSGVCFLQLGDFQSTIDYLKKYKTSSDIIGARANELLGHAYAELSETSKAAKHYTKAANMIDDKYLTPYYMQLAGDYYVSLNDYDKALSLFEQLKSEYPLSSEGQNIDRYIEFVKNKK